MSLGPSISAAAQLRCWPLQRRLAQQSKQSRDQAQPDRDTVDAVAQTGADGKRQGKGARTFFKITVKVRSDGSGCTAWQATVSETRAGLQDNGTGMPHGDIPQLLGRVLSGTKYGVQQTRGKFGLGAKMALIWSKMSTGMPIDVRSAEQGQTFISHYSLGIDIHKCAPAAARPAQSNGTLQGASPWRSLLANCRPGSVGAPAAHSLSRACVLPAEQ